MKDVDALPKGEGAWVTFASCVEQYWKAISGESVCEFACAVIEMVLRDAEVDRNRLRTSTDADFLEEFPVGCTSIGVGDPATLRERINEMLSDPVTLARIERVLYFALISRRWKLVRNPENRAPP